MEPNQEYIQKRAALIPIAESYANEVCGATSQKLETPKKTEEEHIRWVGRWNNAFHGKMQQLARLHC